LEDFLKKYELYMDDDAEEKTPGLIKIVRFNEEDIMRSELVKHVLDIYNHSSQKNILL
jgi:phosphate starvation-inducible protein PhoH